SVDFLTLGSVIARLSTEDSSTTVAIALLSFIETFARLQRLQTARVLLCLEEVVAAVTELLLFSVLVTCFVGFGAGGSFESKLMLSRSVKFLSRENMDL
ncbi:unnamed protein product, partial [Heterotrigona itama]